MYRPRTPYWPSRYTVHGRTRFSSRQIESTICAAAAPGAYQAEVPRSSTISPPPKRVRSTSLRILALERSSASGIPATAVADTTGTIWSPWPPSTIAVTSLTETSSSCAMKAEKRAVSRIPAMPTTRCFGNREVESATWHMASSGFETTTTTACGERRTASFVTAETIASFVVTRSSRLMPGARGLPAVITTTSEPAVSS
jgi:hypothetical protein